MGSEQHYSLRWNDYTVKICTAFQSLRDEEDFVDVTVACDGHSYSAHKMVLSACSPYFRALLRANPCQHPIVILKDVGHVELERLLEFMYNGEVSIAQDQLAAFLKTAENLKIRGLAGSSDDMEQMGQLQRPDVSYSYSSCSIGGGTSGRSSPSAGYAHSQGSKDEEAGGDGSGGYHTRAGSPPSKRRKRPNAPAASHAESNTATHPTEGVVGEAPVEGDADIGGVMVDDELRKDRRELKSEPGDLVSDMYSETSEITDPASHTALPGPSGSATGNSDSIGPHEPGAGAVVVAWALAEDDGSNGGEGFGTTTTIPMGTSTTGLHGLVSSSGVVSSVSPMSAHLPEASSRVGKSGGECIITSAPSPVGGGAGGVMGTGSGRLYPCPDCEKVFRHPRSYYQHQHVHRGTHSCPGCGKLFSRRWDLLRHLNKNKYGCPARWREGGSGATRPPPWVHNSLSLSALASAAAAASASSSQDDNVTIFNQEMESSVVLVKEEEEKHEPEPHSSVSWTIPTVVSVEECGGEIEEKRGRSNRSIGGDSSSSSSSNSNNNNNSSSGRRRRRHSSNSNKRESQLRPPETTVNSGSSP